MNDMDQKSYPTTSQALRNDLWDFYDNVTTLHDALGEAQDDFFIRAPEEKDKIDIEACHFTTICKSLLSMTNLFILCLRGERMLIVLRSL
jgi:thiamine pyrophosphokinase